MMLVEGSTAKLQNILVQKICGSGIAEDIMKKDPRIIQLRKNERSCSAPSGRP
jgi:hypothetical protein